MLTTCWRNVLSRMSRARPLTIFQSWLVGLGLAFVLAVTSQPVLALDKDQLWLPRNYYRYFRELYDAAEIVEATERCVYIIDGTINTTTSTKKHPIFKITCRDPNRLTFAYMVDGLSLKILNLPPPPDPEELARRERVKILTGFWDKCMAHLEHRTARLKARKWVTEAMPEDQSEAIFAVEFDGRSDTGRRLGYVGRCDFTGEKPAINIHARLPEPELPAIPVEEE